MNNIDNSDNENIKYYFLLNDIPSIDELPWKNDMFDAYLILLDNKKETIVLAKKACSKLAIMNNDWIEIFGPNSEKVHDYLDRESVRVGRQKTIGEGRPMTAWFKEITDYNDFAEYIASGGLGSCDNQLIIIIGKESGNVIIDNLKRSVNQ